MSCSCDHYEVEGGILKLEKLIKLTIDGKAVEVPSTATVMEAADKLGINIPRLCFLKGINETSACRLCVVEVEGTKALKSSCTLPVVEGMNIKTNTERIRNAVKFNLKLLAASHKFECWVCPREHNCEFLKLLRIYGVANVMGEDPTFSQKTTITNINDAIAIDSSKCILCGRCISACQKLAGVGILDFNYRGFETYVGPALNHPMGDTGCILCGKCIQSCPTGAIREKDDVDTVIDVLDNSDYYTIAQIAPAVRASIGEEFGFPMGTNVEGKIYSALNALGFDDITDTNFAADLTILEEGTEFINRVKKFLAGEKTVLPMFTSCSPGWINYLETYYPEYIPNLSSCKSPQQMQGAIIKNVYADKIGVPKEKIKVISIMPCIAKKTEALRPEMEVDGVRDVDYVLTAREFARLVKRKQIDFANLPEFVPTSPMAQYTGAGVIFGATGGVMEAALRTVKEVLEEKEMGKVDITSVRGMKDIKEATIKIQLAGAAEPLEVLVAVVHGAVHIPEMMDKIKKGKKQYAFIEFMGCTGGCINGGGQPIVSAEVQDKVDVRAQRAKALYALDKRSQVRKSHENEAVQNLYKESLGEPGSHKAHKLLHTTYKKRDTFTKV